MGFTSFRSKLFLAEKKFNIPGEKHLPPSGRNKQENDMYQVPCPCLQKIAYCSVIASAFISKIVFGNSTSLKSPQSGFLKETEAVPSESNPAHASNFRNLSVKYYLLGNIPLNKYYLIHFDIYILHNVINDV